MVSAQETSGKPAEKPVGSEKPADKTTIPFQIQLLDTHIRFEADGDSRKEVHTIIKLNNAVGAQQFSRLGFDYNRAFQQVEIPLVRIIHGNGGTSDVLPSAVTDAPNPAVEKYPAYQDIRVKSVRILGLQEGDTVEYRVITTTTKAPLAPDFWLEHRFDRSGQVLEELYEVDLPSSRQVQTAFADSTPPTKIEQGSENSSGRVLYRWNLSAANARQQKPQSERPVPEIVLSTFSSWKELASRLGGQLIPNEDTVRELAPRAREIAQQKVKSDDQVHAIYDFVSQKIATVDLPPGATGFRARPVSEILSSGYATPEDKFVLFAALSNNFCGPAMVGLLSSSKSIDEHDLARPSVFDHLLTMTGYPSINFWMDLNLEVAPYRMIPSQFRGKQALLVGPAVSDIWSLVLETVPFAAFQKVAVNAKLGEDGTLSAKVKYTLRGDNELLLRMAYHQTPKEKWKEVAGLLALSDGFRGVITSATASDPMETTNPFTVEYELAQEKFVDWSKKPVRIPALLPQIGLPETTGKNSAGNIELGTPLDVETQETLHLPEGTNVQAPAGTAVQRDYATYSSKYGFTAGTLTALRHIHFIQREVAADRAIDYSAFVQAVQNDQSQYFVLDRGAGVQSTAMQ
jgi:hypothetical protein